MLCLGTKLSPWVTGLWLGRKYILSGFPTLPRLNIAVREIAKPQERCHPSLEPLLHDRKHLLLELAHTRRIGLQRKTHEQRLKKIIMVLIAGKGHRRGGRPYITIF